MTEVAAAPAPAQAANGGQQRTFSNVIGAVVRMGLMFAVMSYMRSGKKDDGVADGTAQQQPAAGAAAAQSREADASLLRPYFRPGEVLHMEVYIADKPGHFGRNIWTEPGVRFGPSDLSYYKSVVVSQHELSRVLEHNKTLHLVVRFSRRRVPLPSPEEVAAKGRLRRSDSDVFWVSLPLIEWRPHKEDGGTKFLLTSASGDDKPPDRSNAQDAAPSEAVDDLSSSADDMLADGSSSPMQMDPYFKPNLTISLVNDFAVHKHSSLQPVMLDAMNIDERRNRYYPNVLISEFWLLRDYLIPINSTVSSVDLHLDMSTISQFWWLWQLGLQDSIAKQKEMGLMGVSQVDEMKRIFLEGNPYFLALTMIVSVLHTVFDMLAFKSDIGFWNKNKSMEGLSARTVIINAFCQLVIFLYILNNETSMLIIGSIGIGTLIEFWKITKVMNVSIETEPGKLPRLKIQNRSSYVESSTQKWDDEATRWMLILLIPCVIGYFVYSLIYHQHKNWYSFILEAAVGTVYAFGFVLMCPQLYLNYKLKSVAHLPWRQMTYKFLNTIVDDLGAFIIKAPLLYRLAVFRDDVVFCIFLYQRWIYRVDKTRPNEFGFSAEAPEEPSASDRPLLPDTGASDAGDADAGSAATQLSSKQRRKDAAAQDQPAVADATPSGANDSAKDK